MKGVTLKHISSIAEAMGMAARGVKVALESLSQLKLPAILHWDMNHFVVLTHVNGDTITVQRPGARTARAQAGRSIATTTPASRWRSRPTQRLQEARRARADQRVATGASATGLKGAITQVLLLSLVLEVLAIAMPFFLQLVVDRVVVGRDRDLLAVLGIAFVLLADDRESSPGCAPGSACTSARGSTCNCSTRFSHGCCGCRSRGSRSAISATSSRASGRSTRSSAR